VRVFEEESKDGRRDRKRKSSRGKETRKPLNEEGKKACFDGIEKGKNGRDCSGTELRYLWNENESLAQLKASNLRGAR